MTSEVIKNSHAMVEVKIILGNLTCHAWKYQLLELDFVKPVCTEPAYELSSKFKLVHNVSAKPRPTAIHLKNANF